MLSRRSILTYFAAFPSLVQSSMAKSPLSYADFDPLLWKIETDTPPSDTGLISLNKTGFKELGAQRGIPRYLAGSMMLRDDAKVHAGLTGLERMFTYRDPARGFPYAGSHNSNPLDAQQDRLLTQAFFMMELLQAWHIAQCVPFGRQYLSEIQHFVDLMQPDALEMQGEIDEMMVSNLSAANRVIICLRTAALLNAAYKMRLPIGRYVSAVLAMQTKEGYFLEKNGSDVSYDAASILFASDTLLVSYNQSLREAVERSARWLASKVSDSGKLLSNDDTRTAGQETFNGKQKGPNFGEIASALVCGAALTSDPSMLIKAQAVWDCRKNDRRG